MSSGASNSALLGNPKSTAIGAIGAVIAAVQAFGATPTDLQGWLTLGVACVVALQGFFGGDGDKTNPA